MSSRSRVPDGTEPATRPRVAPSTPAAPVTGPLVSIAIYTRNRADLLYRVLGSIIGAAARTSPQSGRS